MTPRQIRILHRQFLRRQTQYELRFARRMRSILTRQYRAAAEIYPQPYIVSPEDYRGWYEQIYTTVLPREAEQAWSDFVKPLAGERKDFFDDLMAVLGIIVPEGEFIRLWRDVSREWLTVNILARIQSVAETTQRAIAKVVETAVNEGSSIPAISKAIRKEANGEINRNRATLIARTETISAMNKGRRLSMYTSNLKWNKRWVDTPDNRTRLSHRAIAQQDWRELEASYWLVNRSGTLEPADCPGDPRLSAENVCNCRCTEVYEVMRDASGRPVRRSGSPVVASEAMEAIA